LRLNFLSVDINAMYVAMTRAKERLVISAHQPHQTAANSTYQRVQTAWVTGATVLEQVSGVSEDTPQPTQAKNRH
jgi:ATP-dependent exoDNAse (exonuclease V) beta subunit